MLGFAVPAGPGPGFLRGAGRGGGGTSQTQGGPSTQPEYTSQPQSQYRQQQGQGQGYQYLEELKSQESIGYGPSSQGSLPDYATQQTQHHQQLNNGDAGHALPASIYAQPHLSYYYYGS
jgi:hypothetical protein